MPHSIRHIINNRGIQTNTPSVWRVKKEKMRVIMYPAKTADVTEISVPKKDL